MKHFRDWNLKRLFLSGVFSAAIFAASFVLGAAITTALGPGTSGIVTIIITTILIVIGCRVIDTPGALTLMVTIFTVFAIPTNLMGPPGPHKIIIGIIVGAIYDFIWIIMRGAKYSLPTAAAFSTGATIVLIFYLMAYLNHPRFDALKSIIQYVIPLYAFLGFIGAMIGNWIYDKSLSQLSIIRNLKE